MSLERTDLSDSLIHFVSGGDTSTMDYYMSEMHPKEFNMNGDEVEENSLSPFFILRRVIRSSQLLSTWSYRNGSRTIYGKYPVICFTEMPISEFVKTSITRQAKGHKISNYAFIFNKQQMFSVGARPVIYGCSQEVEVTETSNLKSLHPPIFDEKELYRYVAFNLDRLPYPIDWTHEREWRWPNFKYKYYPIDLAFEGDIDDQELLELHRKREEERIDFHGLNLDCEPLSNIGIILKTEEQARLVIRDILWLIDSKKIRKNLFRYVLFFNYLEENVEKLSEKAFVKQTIKKGLIKIEKFFQVDYMLKQSTEKAIHAICEKYKGFNDFENPHPGGLTGISFPCIIDNQKPVVRALVDLGLVKYTKLGRYLLNLPILHPSNYLENNEHFVRKILIPELEEKLEIELTYYSVGDMSNKKSKEDISINDVPFYTEPNDDEWNYAHREEDF